MTLDGILNPNQQEIAMRLFTADNARQLREAGINPTEQNLGVAHFLGAGGAIKLIEAMKRNPNQAAAPLFSKLEVEKNPKEFYKQIGDKKNPESMVPRTVLELYQKKTTGYGTTPFSNKYDDLRSLPLDQQQKIRSQAETTMLKQEQAEVTATQQQYKMQLDQIKIDAYRGDFTPVQFEQAYQVGFFQSAADYKSVKDAIDGFQKGRADLARGQAMVSSGQTFDPFKSDNKEGMDAAYKALPPSENKLATGIEWGRQTGVMPAEVVSDMRRAILSPDPKIAAQALTLANQLLLTNPNALLGVSNSDVITSAVAAFRSNFENTKDPRNAAAMVAEMRSPEFQAKQKFRDEEAKKLKDRVFVKDPTTEIKEVLDPAYWFKDIYRQFTADAEEYEALKFRPTPQGSTGFQGFTQSRLLADYGNYIERGFQLTGNQDAAVQWAKQRLKSVYGVVDQKIMKYPMTKAYPPVNGSHRIYLEQAAAEVRKAAAEGPDKMLLDVKPEDIVLDPVPGLTAQIYENGKQPTPYHIMYLTKDSMGNTYMATLLSKDNTPAIWYGAMPTTADWRGGDFKRLEKEEGIPLEQTIPLIKEKFEDQAKKFQENPPRPQPAVPPTLNDPTRPIERRPGWHQGLINPDSPLGRTKKSDEAPPPIDPNRPDFHRGFINPNSPLGRLGR